jgi:hypothetical protein
MAAGKKKGQVSGKVAKKKAAAPAVTKKLGPGKIRELIEKKKPVAAGAVAFSAADESTSQYRIFVENTSNSWVIVGWSYEPDEDQTWKRLQGGPVFPREKGLVLTGEGEKGFSIFFIARKNPDNPTDPVCYSPEQKVEDGDSAEYTIHWIGCND